MARVKGVARERVDPDPDPNPNTDPDPDLHDCIDHGIKKVPVPGPVP